MLDNIMGENRQRNRIILASIVLIIVAIVVYLVWPTGIRNAETSVAIAVQVNGEVHKIAEDGSVLSAITEGAELVAGESLKTGADSSLTLKFADDSKLLVADKSIVMLVHMASSKDSGAAETIVMVKAGAAESRVSKQKGFGAKYEVRTPAMQLSVRGTQFIVRVDAATGKSSSMVYEGAVEAEAGGEKVELKAGFGTIAKVGEAPSKPRALLNGPNINAVPALIEQPALLFSWQSIDGAKQYRVQFLSGSGYENLAYNTVQNSTELSLNDLPDADYMMRVRAIDELGMEGKNAQQLFSLNAHPFAPKLTKPIDVEVNGIKKVKFYWDKSAEAGSYLFQISDTEDFSNIVSQVKNLPGKMSRLSVRLAPGSYFWRIASSSEEEGLGPFSDAKHFTVVKPQG